MNTSFANRLRGRVGCANLRRIIARTLLVLGLAVVVSACTATRLAYNQAPSLGFWWLDKHFDFDDAQSPGVRDEIDGFFAWHRREELPAYAGLLRQWQTLALRDITADEACLQFDTVLERLWASGERAIEPFARLAPSLSQDQLAYLQRQQARSNDDFARDFLNGSAEQRLQRRLDTTIERSERLYGDLRPEQEQLLRQWLARSPWDPARTQAERERRQADLLNTLRAARQGPAQATALLRGHAERLQRSPFPGHQAHNEAAIRHGCAQFAALHNSTSPEQRAHAVQALQGYARDFDTLSAQR